MGLFGKRQSSITFAPGAVNIDKQPAKGDGSITLDEAHRALRLDEGQTLFEEGIWRMRSQDCGRLVGERYWLGTLKKKGSRVGIFVNNKHVGNLEPRSQESGAKVLKEYGGNQARCVISNTGPSSWNVYVDMR
jgi:hypothetical protein